MENIFAYFDSKKIPSEFLVEQRVKSNEQRAKSNEQRAKSNEQRVKSNEKRAKSNEQQAKSFTSCPPRKMVEFLRERRIFS